jgi:PIN domain nuclease of toxin-antitoxin system
VVSIATIWEIGIKAAIGKLSLSKPFREWTETAIADLVLTVLPTSLVEGDRFDTSIAASTIEVWCS